MQPWRRAKPTVRIAAPLLSRGQTRPSVAVALRGGVAASRAFRPCASAWRRVLRGAAWMGPPDLQALGVLEDVRDAHAVLVVVVACVRRSLVVEGRPAAHMGRAASSTLACGYPVKALRA
jgi:hypothetical protein